QSGAQALCRLCAGAFAQLRGGDSRLGVIRSDQTGALRALLAKKAVWMMLPQNLCLRIVFLQK
ncbi:MAG: hypothetical protein ACI3U1_10325, partial [Peptococcaceae bacterium]